jgi:hypothetical protein
MNDVIEITPEQYAQVIELLEQARKLLRKEKRNRKHLTLDQRVALMREANRLREQALAIGK